MLVFHNYGQVLVFQITGLKVPNPKLIGLKYSILKKK